MEWKEVRLGDYITIKHGYAFPGSGITTEDNNKVLVTPGNFKIGGGFKEDKCKFFHGIIPEDYILNEGDLIVTMTDLSKDIDTLGYSAIIPKSDKRTYLHNQRIGLVNIENPGIDKMFLNYLMRYYNYQKFVANSSTGTTVHHTSPSRIYDYSFYLPPIEDQKRIADILSSLDAKIENNNKINAKLEEMAQALFKSWFIDFEPFKDGPFVESELGMIPEGWKVGSPYEYFDVIYGAPYKSALFNSDGNGLPLIRIRDLKDCKPQFYSPEILPNTEFVEYGDIVAGMDAEFTPYVWRGERGLLNQRVCKIVPKNLGISRLYGLLLFKPELEYVQSYKTGTTVSHLGKADIDRFKVILPSDCIAKQFSAIVDSILNEQILLAKEINNLAQTRDTLLPKLMSGEIEL